MEVIYRSTRSNSEPVTASQAILKGLSDDGGLFVPDHIPALDKSLSELAGMSYQQVAYEAVSYTHLQRIMIIMASRTVV